MFLINPLVLSFSFKTLNISTIKACRALSTNKDIVVVVVMRVFTVQQSSTLQIALFEMFHLPKAIRSLLELFLGVFTGLPSALLR